jgi:thiol:disulfide interchange protein DsbD
MALCLLGVSALPAPGFAQPVKTAHVTAELIAASAAVVPGQPVQIGLRLQHIPHWHTYWRNPGDSGLPTTLGWTLPDGATVGEINWPAPQRLPIGPLINYGYEGELLLPLSFTPPADARPGSTLRLAAAATWLVCKDICIPEEANLTLLLPVAEAGVVPGHTAHVALFEQAAGRQSQPLQGWTTALQQAGSELLLTIEQTSGAATAERPVVHVFPYTEQLIEPARHELYRTDKGYALKLSVLNNASLPSRFDGIAVVQAKGGAQPVALWGNASPSAEFNAPVSQVAAISLPAGAVLLDGAGAAAAAAVAKGGAVQTEQLGGSTAQLGLLAALALALLGGMVLNLMPCVFPVLSIKLLSLVKHGSSPAGLRRHAMAYSAGVVLSFLALAGGLLALRAAGSAVGWGFQLQEPGVVFVLALLFFAIGLNLMGAFEFVNMLPQKFAGWRAVHPAADAFGAGVLAVVAASPCTAPFMGAALGFAVTQSAPMALGVFAALGIGMALPYVALVLSPGWRARLPRPGPWMLRLKQGLAFPMFATVVWLIWVLGLQAGIDGAAKALLALVGLGFAIWLGGLLRHRGSPAAPLMGGGVALATAALLVWSWPGLATEAQASTRGAARTTADDHGRWLPYREADALALVAQGKPVFVDFTAAWCVSCQVNKRLVLGTAATQADFDAAQVTLMRADWTLRDAEITAALAKLGRNGVPVYVLMRPGKEPLLLPEILTAGLVREALATLQP